MNEEFMISPKKDLNEYSLKKQNIELMHQLDDINRNLEKIVQDRTYQLEESLKNLKEEKEALEYMNYIKDKRLIELEELSCTDPLTGIANRRKLTDFIEIEWKRAARQKNKIALIMIDIDHFKFYNDYYGHAMGDKCLKQVAAIIKKQLKRSADLAARYGGEEFCCVLPGENISGAVKVAKNILSAMEIAAISHESSPISSYITVSIGVYSMLTSNLNSREELVQHTDKYLYEAKKNGRNCIWYEKNQK